MNREQANPYEPTDGHVADSAKFREAMRAVDVSEALNRVEDTKPWVIRLAVLLFLLPPIVIVRIAWKCLDSVAVLNGVGGFYMTGLHALLLLVLLISAVFVAKRLRGSKGALFVGLILGLVYVSAAIVSFVIVVTSALLF